MLFFYKLIFEKVFFYTKYLKSNATLKLLMESRNIDFGDFSIMYTIPIMCFKLSL